MTDAPVCTIDGRCTCPTCGVALALLKGALASAGLTEDQRNRVAVRGYDFRGGAEPALASVYVDGPRCSREVARIQTVTDVLQPDIVADVLKLLETP